MPTRQEHSYVAPLTKNFKFFLCGVIVFVLLSVTLPIMIFGPVDKDGGSQGLLISVFVGAAVALIIIPIIFSSTRIDLLETSIKITTMKFFSKELPYSEIEQAEVGPVTGLAMGAGLRIMGGGHTGYLTGGPSITLTLTNGSRVTASATNPEQVAAEVNSRLGSAA
ncbi:hypothetical protein [Rothia nasimurium]|uniref:hypothetical protein n=1 Tax=Rothia nasimurium TaxID=85336 RepID=UPI001F235C84|nr:hypothetical protein [Rothia nasimurium]